MIDPVLRNIQWSVEANSFMCGKHNRSRIAPEDVAILYNALVEQVRTVEFNSLSKGYRIEGLEDFARNIKKALGIDPNAECTLGELVSVVEENSRSAVWNSQNLKEKDIIIKNLREEVASRFGRLSAKVMNEALSEQLREDNTDDDVSYEE